MTCIAYADLNPVRAGMARDIDRSDYTSIKQRVQEILALQREEKPEKGPRLLDFAGDEGEGAPDGLPFSLDDYIELVDWSGRVVRDDNRGAIDDSLPPILERLEIDVDTWRKLLRDRKGLRFHHAVGRASAIKENAVSFGRAFLKGLSFAQKLFPEPEPG